MTEKVLLVEEFSYLSFDTRVIGTIANEDRGSFTSQAKKMAYEYYDKVVEEKKFNYVNGESVHFKIRLTVEVDGDQEEVSVTAYWMTLDEVQEKFLEELNN